MADITPEKLLQITNQHLRLTQQMFNLIARCVDETGRIPSPGSTHAMSMLIHALDWRRLPEITLTSDNDFYLVYSNYLDEDRICKFIITTSALGFTYCKITPSGHEEKTEPASNLVDFIVSNKEWIESICM